VIVDNGGSVIGDEWQDQLSVACIWLRENYRQIIARNIGAKIGRSELLFFLDDDSVLDPEGIGELIEFYKNPDILAARCRLKFQTDTVFNRLAAHYDLGDEVISGYLLESGLSIRREIYAKFDGYDESLAPGGEYLYWLYNVGSKYGLDRTVYCPRVIIKTDYARSLKHYVWKHWTYAKGLELMRRDYPEIIEFKEQLKRRPDATRPSFRGLAWWLRMLGKSLSWGGRHYFRLTTSQANAKARG
jgi:glycosyltransferase involved in cell wall biosynthesis